MALKDMKNKNNNNSGNRTPSEGVVFRVESHEGTGSAEAPFLMKGTAVMGNDVVKENEEITVSMKASFNEGQIGALTKNIGKAPGSVLMLDSCYRDNNGVIISGWVNTITSEKEKSSDPESEHHHRDVLEVTAEVPVLTLANPELEQGEPKTIYWRLNQDTLKVGDNTFDRNWLKAKVAAADKKDVKIYFEMFEPDASQLVTDKESLAEVIAGLVQTGHSALIRAFDSDGDVMTRKAYGNQDNDAQQTLDRLSADGIIYNVDNDELFSGVAQGEVKLEVIPMDRKYYVGKTKESILSGFTGGRSKQMIGAFGMGDNTNSIAEVYAPVQTQNPGQENEWQMPLGAMTRAGLFAGSFDNLETPHFGGAVDAAPVAEANKDEDEPAFASPGIAASGN